MGSSERIYHRISIILLNFLLYITTTYSVYSPSVHKIWNTRTIPYVINSDIDDSIRQSILTAFDIMRSDTCITFEEKTSLDYDYLHIMSGSSCETYVGRQGGEQVLRLSKMCDSGVTGVSPATILHELMHTLGFYHEHQRIDRNSYIQVLSSNIQRGKYMNFMQAYSLSDRINALPYDYESITHYGNYTFSVTGQLTIRTLDPSKQGLIGQQCHLSQMDLLKTQIYYNCENGVVDTCESVPESIAHGSWSTVRGEDNKVGQMIEYSCSPGYTLVGPTFRSCLLDGHWQAYSPLCLTPLHYCNFDDDNWCGWTRSYEGQTSDYWYLNSRGTRVQQTGPTDDYTTMDSRGMFAYVESLSSSAGDVAILTSPEFQTFNEPICFRFANSMYGTSIGSLKVYQRLDGESSLITSWTGNQGAEWLTYKHTLPTNSNLQIEFRLEMLGLTKGDIALDDLLIVECSQIQHLS